jgi:hypothetical protein
MYLLRERKRCKVTERRERWAAEGERFGRRERERRREEQRILTRVKEFGEKERIDSMPRDPLADDLILAFYFDLTASIYSHHSHLR